MPRRYWTAYDDEDEDDLDFRVRQPQGGASQAGLVSLLSALGGLGLMAFVGVLWLAVGQQGDLESSALLLVAILGLNFVAFVASLAGVVLGFRAQAPANLLYRGHGVAGIVCGIAGLVFSLLAGAFALCAGLLVAAVAHVPGG